MTVPNIPCPICLTPIGIVHRTSDIESMLDLQPAFVDGLLGITDSDALQMLYWMHELPAEAMS